MNAPRDSRAWRRLAAPLAAWAAVTAGAALARRWAGHWAPAAAAALLLLAPVLAERRPRRLLVPSARRAALGALDGALAALLLVPAFWGAAALLGRLDFSAVSWGALAARAPRELALIALPEEFFFRGYLQRRLEAVCGARARVAGARCGPGLAAAAGLFALSHLAATGWPAALLVLFPGLAFGWLRARRRSVAGPAVLHAACNLSLAACPGLFAW